MLMGRDKQEAKLDGRKNEERRGEAAAEMFGRLSFPLLNYCSVYLVRPINHSAATRRE